MPEKGTESIEQSIKNEVEKKEALELLRSEVMVEINRDLGDRFTSGEIVSPDLNAVAFVEADRREENDGMFRVVAGDKESEIVEYVGEVTWGKNSKSMVCSVQPAGEDYPMACFNFVTDRKHFENVWMPEKMKVRPDGENYGCVVESNTGCACNFLIDGEEVVLDSGYADSFIYEPKSKGWCAKVQDYETPKYFLLQRQESGKQLRHENYDKIKEYKYSKESGDIFSIVADAESEGKNRYHNYRILKNQEVFLGEPLVFEGDNYSYHELTPSDSGENVAYVMHSQVRKDIDIEKEGGRKVIRFNPLRQVQINGEGVGQFFVGFSELKWSSSQEHVFAKAQSEKSEVYYINGLVEDFERREYVNKYCLAIDGERRGEDYDDISNITISKSGDFAYTALKDKKYVLVYQNQEFDLGLKYFSSGPEGNKQLHNEPLGIAFKVDIDGKEIIEIVTKENDEKITKHIFRIAKPKGETQEKKWRDDVEDQLY